MSGRFRNIAIALAAACLGAIGSAANAITVPELQRLLQTSARQSVPFEEKRESPWLEAPMTSRGTMHSTPQSLEKRVESPRQETWRLLPDRIEWIGSGGAGRKQILFSQAPAVAPLADVMRRVAAGDVAALERDFRIELHGDERAWRARLQPRGPDVGRYIESVELQGTVNRLQVIIVAERQGERTTIRLLP
ncbi:MAG: hypothetical protein JWQ07_2894 [Ramlibacter sp.]|nr:hypothetical protein [Ramlibacter sp.]